MLDWFRLVVGNGSPDATVVCLPIENSLFGYNEWEHVMMDGFGMGGGGIGMLLLLVIAVLLIAVLIKILAK